MLFLYSIGIRVYFFCIHLAAFFNSKARKTIEGRKRFLKTNKDAFKDQEFIWFHCASLGEFEQGRPLIEKIKKEHPSKKILLSFFSPSGYEIRKNYHYADVIVYLPFDTKKNANKFFNTFRITMAVVVKYDIWPFYFSELIKREIPFFITSVVFRKNQYYFKWYGAFVKKMLCRAKGIFVQNEASKLLAEQNGLMNVKVTGDVRVDRVIEIKDHIEEMMDVKAFLNHQPCIVFGSIYRSDEPVIDQLMQEEEGKHFKFILAPHQVDASTLSRLSSKYPDHVLFSQLKSNAGQRMLLVDNIGTLNKLYQYADLVYIGGGYGAGIHNILEPAVFNVPVFFGPHYHKFPEAISLIEKNLAISCSDPIQMAKTMIYNSKKNKSPEFQTNSKKWFEKQGGATDLVFRELALFF